MGIADAQMNVTNHGVCGTPSILRLALDDIEQIADIERIGAHGNTVAIPLPRYSDDLNPDFDTVALGISQIDGFTYLVIPCTADRQLLVDGAARPTRKVATCGSRNAV